jgi:predicted ATPase/class 3 adenylate cyclase
VESVLRAQRCVSWENAWVAGLPSGTVTFLFTDMEGSTRRWETDEAQMHGDLAHHDDVVRGAVDRHDGTVFATGGDGFAVVFARAGDALGCAIEVQRSLRDAGLPPVRMGVHTGEAEERGGDYFGPAVNRAARLMAVGHGGQILVSHATEQVVRERLADSVGLVDLGEHRLRDLSTAERVFQVAAPELPGEFPRLGSLDTSRTNLPIQLTSFVGRETEIALVGELLTEHRIVTLTGIGGVGKTRLAVHLAAELLERSRDGVWLIELASVEPPRVVEVIAASFGIQPLPGRSTEDRLFEQLHDRELVLVLDNCEHVVREVRRVIELLLRAAPDVRVLATSREGLRVSGEQLFAVASLDDDAAVRLFVERATAVDATFRLTASERGPVLGVVDRLDGIPLAIELAAARVSMFNLDELARRLDRRFRLLIGGRGAVERHQTLRAAIDWSYDLLSDTERRTFARLSVFAGGCTLEAAEGVVADVALDVDGVLDALSGLVDKSLVIVDRTHLQTRYDMLETIRQYAEEQLLVFGDAEAARARHAQWYATFARAAGRGLYSSDEARWFECLGPEIDNLQVAVNWAVGADESDVAMRIAGAFPRGAMARPLLGTGYLAEAALRARDVDEHPLRARVMAEAAFIALCRQDAEAGDQLLEASIEAQRHGARYAAAAYTYRLLTIAWDEGSGAYETAQESLAAALAAGDTLGAIGSRIALAAQAMVFEHPLEAREQAEQALLEARQLHQPTLEAAALYANALAISEDDPERAIALCHETLELARRIGLDSERLSTLNLLGALEARHGDARRSLEIFREQLDAPYMVRAFVRADLYVGTQVFLRMGRPDLVARCEGQCRGQHLNPPPYYAKFQRDAVQQAQATLGDDIYAAYAAAGEAQTLDQFREQLLPEIDELLASPEVHAAIPFEPPHLPT